MITIKYETIEGDQITWDEIYKRGDHTLASVALEGVNRGWVAGVKRDQTAIVIPWHRVIEIHEGR